MKNSLVKKINQRGQGLLELIVAIGIITGALMSILTLTTSSVGQAEESGTMIVASNLAREGVEVVRNIRDTNWLVGNKKWDSGLAAGNDYTAIAVFDLDTMEWHLEFAPDNMNDDATKLYLSNGVYNQNDLAGTGNLTKYRRLITLDEICASGEIRESGQSCDPSNIKIGIRVTAEINWFVKGIPRKIIVEDRIYNWR